MSTANINVRTDASLKMNAQKVLESIGLDLSTAVNLFLRQTVKVNDLPFTIGTQQPQRLSRRGVWKGKYELPEDFDAIPSDFAEYL
ncbi:MAG: type II toxin-antitoxin system RelB/DinJ family antitoxin [Defluviitaleaceae bacterium]|nr:type II toxin-antitoxin system RelB/DinJ family antitoxin [Defluviitaleaceae bacterium]